ncbi:YpoC family protein [Psychrobacillus sp. NPDC058041]|uniref:YpoC family protein n=1 Tax=Psychrobacillus sp. NPDC058041 TaxID=3346310 RepID=UPI0036DF1414
MFNDNSIDVRSKFAEWDQLKEKLAMLFRSEDESRHNMMEHSILLLTQILDESEEARPINFSDRLEFIKKNIHNYTSFRQLDELFKETKKKIAVKKILDNK